MKRLPGSHQPLMLLALALPLLVVQLASVDARTKTHTGSSR
jgi:hypothetical protein